MTRPLPLALALLLGLLSAPAPLRAQDPDERFHVAADLVDVMDMETTLRRTMELMMEKQIEANPDLAPFRDLMLEYVGRALEWQAIRGDVIELYASTFAADDMRALREFYLTPSGRRLLALTPELSAGMQAITEARMALIMPEMEQAIMKEAMGASD